MVKILKILHDFIGFPINLSKFLDHENAYENKLQQTMNAVSLFSFLKKFIWLLRVLVLHVIQFSNQGSNPSPDTGAQESQHWTTREVPLFASISCVLIFNYVSFQTHTKVDRIV